MIGDELCRAGIVDENIDAPPGVGRRAGEPLTILVARDVGLDEAHIRAGFAYSVGGLFGLRLAACVVDHDIRATPCQTDGDGRPDAGRRTCDNCGFALEIVLFHVSLSESGAMRDDGARRQSYRPQALPQGATISS